jgi:hypothetical protein
MRTDVVPAALGEVAATAFVSGDAAAALDYSSYYIGRLLLVVPVVLALSFLLLLVAFHSVAVPIKAILLNLLSAGSAFGILVLVFQDGWLHGQTGIQPGVIDASNPVMMFAIPGLSMTQGFILCRIRRRAIGVSRPMPVKVSIIRDVDECGRDHGLRIRRVLRSASEHRVRPRSCGRLVDRDVVQPAPAATMKATGTGGCRGSSGGFRGSDREPEQRLWTAPGLDRLRAPGGVYRGGCPDAQPRAAAEERSSAERGVPSVTGSGLDCQFAGASAEARRGSGPRGLNLDVPPGAGA